MTDIFNQEPPHKEHAEQAVLGSMLSSPSALGEASQNLKAGEFYNPVNQILFERIVKLSETITEVTPTVLANELDKTNDLAKVGGTDYLLKLVESTPTASNVAYFTDAVHDAALQRQVIAVGTRIAQLGHASDADVSDIVTLALGEALTLGDDDRKKDYVIAYEAASELLSHLDDIQTGKVEEGVPTGFRDIDELTRGLQPGQMIVVAGRPAMGKSTLGMDFARSAAIHHDMCTVIFSLEMGRNELMQRIFAAETDIPLSAFKKPDEITADRWTQLNNMWENLKDKPLYIDDSPGVGMGDIRAKCRKLKQSENLKLVVIDYMQLMSSGRRVENRQQEVSNFSRQMKLLAKELQVPVVVLSQLNRSSEMRNDKKPQLSDLRESGSIEQDADVVFLVHRPDFYDKEDRPGEADVIMAKHRNGPTDTFNLAFLGAHSKFKDMPQGYSPQL